MTGPSVLDHRLDAPLVLEALFLSLEEVSRSVPFQPVYWTGNAVLISWGNHMLNLASRGSTCVAVSVLHLPNLNI